MTGSPKKQANPAAVLLSKPGATTNSTNTTNLLDLCSSATFKKCLLAVFVSVVTLWYVVTPYLVRPHHNFKTDFEHYIAQLAGGSSSSSEEGLVENWTKWRLFLGKDDKTQTLYSFQAVSLLNETSSTAAVMEWRQEYTSEIFRKEGGGLGIEHRLPWYSSWGLYNHFYTEETHSSIRYMPKFMFGLKREVLDKMYNNGEDIPITGLLTENPTYDRLLIQCFMNVVTFSVVVLIWTNKGVL